MTNLQAPHLIKEYYKRHPLDSINRGEMQQEEDQSPSWLPPTEPTPSTCLTTPLPGISSPLLLGTSTTTPLLHPLHHPLAKNAANATSARTDPSSTSTPTLPSVMTSTASTIAKCPKYLTPLDAPPFLGPPWHLPPLLTQRRPTTPKTLPSLSTQSSQPSSPPSSHAMTDSNQKSPYSMFPTHPLRPSKKYRHLHSKYASTCHQMASPMPPYPLVQPKPSSVSAETNSLRLCA